MLRAVAADAGPVRVLLLARSAGEWRERLAAAEPAVRELLAGAGGDEPLAATVSGELSNEDLVAAAVPVFAAALGVPAPERVLVEAGPRTVRVLDLHAAALVAVLRSARARGPVRVSVGDVLDELLGHEERFWQGTAGRQGLLGGPTGMMPGRCGRSWRQGRCWAPPRAIRRWSCWDGCRAWRPQRRWLAGYGICTLPRATRLARARQSGWGRYAPTGWPSA